MSEEKKLNEKELTEEELNKVAGGFEILREDIWCEMSYKFTEEETNKLLAHGFQIQPNRTYNIAEMIAMLNLIPQYVELNTLNRHLSSGELGKVVEEMVQRALENILSK